MRVLLALETCSQPKFQARTKKCLDSWVKHLPPEYDFFIATGEALGVPDDYMSLSLKTQAICKYALERGYDYLLICDDDTFIRPHKLRIPRHDYAGHCVEPHDEYPWSYAQGGCYWLSARAMKFVADAGTPSSPTEDFWVGGIMIENDIPLLNLKNYVIAPCACRHCYPKALPEDYAVLLQVTDAKTFDYIASLETYK